MVNDNNLGFAAPPSQQTPKWQSILTAVGAAIPTVVGTYNATRQPPPQYPTPQPVAASPQPVSSQRADYEEDDSRAIRTNVGFSLDRGLNIGGIQIPVLFLALGGVGLYLLFKEPPRRGR
jgi:hypothetical protein